MNKPLTIALSKGELFKKTLALLSSVGLNTEPLTVDDRKLRVLVEEDDVEYLICRPTDVPTYVEHGTADLGVVGKDTLLEYSKEVYELLDLDFGGCRFVLAEPEGSEKATEESYARLGRIRVATKYPVVTEAYFADKGVQVEVIKLHGNVELAPLVGLAERIVDLASTGRTLSANHLRIVDTIAECTARLIANPVSLRLLSAKTLPLIDKLRAAVASR